MGGGGGGGGGGCEGGGGGGGGGLFQLVRIFFKTFLLVSIIF